jgi:uncharacterized protein YcfL
MAMGFRFPALRRLLSLLCLSLCLGASVAQAQSMADKIDYLGSSRHLQITGLKSKVIDGMLNLSIEVFNSDNEDQQGYYRLDWLDDSGFPVWGEEAWKPILLHGEQKLHLPIVAPTPKARDFKIEFSGEKNFAN